MRFYAEKGLGLCGLACVLCSDERCPGCRRKPGNADCSVYRCVGQKGLDGCYACEHFPCDEGMLQNIRVRAFGRYARQFGLSALLDRLAANHAAGIVYHRASGLKGDYDLPRTEQEILQFIQFGNGANPYAQAPVLETERFSLRLVREEDAEDLLACYCDVAAQRLFNADHCSSDFRFQTADEVRRCIRVWLSEYADQVYIRFAIEDKQAGKAVGTVEVHERKYQQTEHTIGVLRIDIHSRYERSPLLQELFAASLQCYDLLHTDRIITKAIPEAAERIHALAACGFLPSDTPDYYVRERSRKC